MHLDVVSKGFLADTQINAMRAITSASFAWFVCSTIRSSLWFQYFKDYASKGSLLISTNCISHELLPRMSGTGVHS